MQKQKDRFCSGVYYTLQQPYKDWLNTNILFENSGVVYRGWSLSEPENCVRL